MQLLQLDQQPYRLGRSVKHWIIGLVWLVGACTQTGPSDSATAAYLQELSKSTTAHYERLIRAYPTGACRYSAEESRSFWAKVDGDLRVIGARIAVLEPGLGDAFNPLRAAYDNAEAFHQTSEQEPERLPGGGSSPCMDPVTAMYQSASLTQAVDLVAQAANPAAEQQ